MTVLGFRIDPDRPSPAALKDTLLADDRAWVEERMRGEGVSVTALAERFKISRKHLSQLLHGHAPLSPALVEKLAGFLGVEPWVLAIRLHDGVVVTDRLEDVPRSELVFHEPAEEPMGEWFSDDVELS